LLFHYYIICHFFLSRDNLQIYYFVIMFMSHLIFSFKTCNLYLDEWKNDSITTYKISIGQPCLLSWWMKYGMRYNFIFHHVILQPNKVVVMAKTHMHIRNCWCVSLCFIFYGHYHAREVRLNIRWVLFSMKCYKFNARNCERCGKLKITSK